LACSATYESQWVFLADNQRYFPESHARRSSSRSASPTDYWLANELKEMTEDLLTDSRTKSRGLFSAEAVQKLIREHRSGKRDWSMQIWQLLTLELWMQNFIDGASDASTQESMRGAIA